MKWPPLADREVLLGRLCRLLAHPECRGSGAPRNGPAAAVSGFSLLQTSLAADTTTSHYRSADLTDAEILQKSLNSTLFPGVPSDVLVHSGFADEHAKTATSILDQVRILLTSSGASTVVSVSSPWDLICSPPLTRRIHRRSATRWAGPSPN